ncbi:MAG: hypothetical protein JSV85_04365 [Candidatus Bathyarchaeota archaeon]|nr:MAG: hypothetical protein JSV85_04365 [Candidatus Bathyarchaeota archaeon]
MESTVQRFTDRILKDARKEAKSIIDKAKRSAEMLLEDRRQSGHQKAKEDTYSLLKRAESEAEIVRGRIATDTKKKASWLVLSEKEHLVTDVLDEVKRKLGDLQKSEKYGSILERMIVDAGEILGGGRLEVMLNKNDSTRPLKIDMLSEAITEKTGVKTHLRPSKQKIEAIGGAVIKTVGGRIIVDNTFEAILKRREKELRFKIARILFSN